MQRVLQRILDGLLDSVVRVLHPAVIQSTLRRIGHTLGRIELERTQTDPRRATASPREDFLACLSSLQRPGAWRFTSIDSALHTITVQVATCPFGPRAAYDHHYCHIEAAMLGCMAEGYFKEATIALRRGAGVPPHDCRVTVHLEPGVTPTASEGLVYTVRGGREPEEPAEQVEAQPSAKLSRRELQILKLITEGLGDKEIAAQLNLSVRTVENHAARIRQKLQIHGRAGLVRYALNHKLTDP